MKVTDDERALIISLRVETEKRKILREKQKNCIHPKTAQRLIHVHPHKGDELMQCTLCGKEWYE